MSEDILQLIDKMSKIDRLEQGHQMLQKAILDMGLSNVAYFAVNLPGRNAGSALYSATYAPAWQKHYQQEGYVHIDPVVSAGLAGVLPIDWQEIDRSSKVVQRFFCKAQDFSIGSMGLSFPIRGRHHEFAMFSVTSDADANTWNKQKSHIIQKLMLLSYHFHDWTIRASGVYDDSNLLDSLTTREKDCLRWRALGKSDWDISKLLTISERTVKFHLENARAKLGAANTTHAVTKAVSLGLIVVT